MASELRVNTLKDVPAAAGVANGDLA